jgi:hypothetical protein
MANKLSVKKYSPQANPDVVILSLTVTGNYVNGTADTLNLNPNTWLDPLNLGVEGEPSLTNPTPSFYNLNAQGYTGFVSKGATLATYGIRWYAPGGAELASGAYPAAITGGELSIELFISPGSLI